jgi:hypothetical protein
MLYLYCYSEGCVDSCVNILGCSFQADRVSETLANRRERSPLVGRLEFVMRLCDSDQAMKGPAQ